MNLNFKRIFTKKNMKSIFILFVILFTLLCVINFYNNNIESFECASNEFKNNLNSSSKKFVLFYADWCPHCTSFKPTWNEVSSVINTDNEIKMLSVNVGDRSNDSEELITEFKVNSFPTIVLLNNDNSTVEIYEGNRDKTSIESFAKNNL